MRTTWTRNALSALEVMAENGNSASEIGKLIGKSRSAVLGKAWRLRISLKSNRRDKS